MFCIKCLGFTHICVYVFVCSMVQEDKYCFIESVGGVDEDALFIAVWCGPCQL